MNKDNYQRLVTKLIYLSYTKPDIAFAIGIVSQFVHAPNEEHMNAVVRILRCLKGAPGKGLLFSKTSNLKVDPYTNADMAGCINDIQFTSWNCIFVKGNLVT